MKKKVAVVIPYYHSNLTAFEQISIQQCLKILKNYPIIFIVPEYMNEQELPNKCDVKYKKLPNKWFENVEAYNSMMLCKDFYQCFLDFKYILIYQMDAFVFYDQLEEFCDLGFDYIGAPWIFGVKYLRRRDKGLWYVGNGGFSLRKVEAFIGQLEKGDLKEITINEDLFWASNDSDHFRVAPIEVALQFAFEQNVQECFQRNNNQLPFGCHAWEKHNYKFWEPFIRKAGYEVKMEKTGNLDNLKIQYEDYSYLNARQIILYKAIHRYISNNSSNIFIWGAGRYGKECGWILQRIGINYYSYVDSCNNKWGKQLWDATIYSPEVLENEECIIIIAVKQNEKCILKHLESKGYKYKRDIYLYSEIIDSIRMYQKLI